MELLTVGDVAKQCQVSRKTVTRAILSGRLCASRLGARGAYRIRPEDVDRWVKEVDGKGIDGATRSYVEYLYELGGAS